VRSVLCVDTNFINWLRCQGKLGLDLCRKCVYVPNYTDLSRLSVSGERKQLPLKLICARRYEEKRGTSLLIEALNLLGRGGFAFEAHISTIGGLDEIRAKLKSCGIGDEVSVSEDSMDEVLKRYGSADLAVVPTVWSEGTSLAAVEAICAGVPVIGTPVGGLGNLIVPGFNGYLVTPTPEAIADAIMRCSDLSSLAHMRANCLSMRDALGHASWTSRVLGWLDG
jgi:glycosyltransferase involved in cell wall biosynthesis